MNGLVWVPAEYRDNQGARLIQSSQTSGVAHFSDASYRGANKGTPPTLRIRPKHQSPFKEI